MANNLPNNPTASIHYMRNGHRDIFATAPAYGEIIMLRLPFAITGGAPSSLPSASAVTGATHHNYHPCIVTFFVDQGTSATMQVMVCRAFSRISSDSSVIQYVNSLDQDTYKQYIPLAWVPAIPVPAAFGPPLSVPNFRSRKPTWVAARLHDITISTDLAYKLFSPRAVVPTGELQRLLQYAQSLVTSNDNSSATAGNNAGGGAFAGSSGGAGGGSGNGAGIIGDPWVTGDAGSKKPTFASVVAGHTASPGAAWYHNPSRIENTLHIECNYSDDDGDEEYESELDKLSFEEFLMLLCPHDPFTIRMKERRKTERDSRIAQWIAGAANGI